MRAVGTWCRAAAPIAVGVAMLIGCSRSEPAAPRLLAAALPPSPGINVLVLSFDALRADALGLYGYERRTSPRIDAFARDALVLERAYSAAPATPTSFTAAFTGCLPHRAFQGWQLRPATTLAGAFAAAGYRTAAFLHNPQLPKARGFDRGFETYDQIGEGEDEPLLERAIAWLGAHRTERFFVWVHMLTPHAPYRRRDDAVQLYDPGYEGPFKDAALPRFVATTPADIRRVRTLYDGEVLHADQLFDHLWQQLGTLDLQGTTLVVLTSDHGEEFNEHGGFRHGRLYGEHLHIPLILRHPRVRRGSRDARLVSNLDLAPTLAAIAGVAWPTGCNGQSLLDPERRRSEAVSLALTDHANQSASLLRDDARLIVTCVPTERRELFALAADPGEQRDVAAARPELTGQLETALWSSLDIEGCPELGLGAMQAETQNLDPHTVESLKALGYVDR